MDRKSLHVIVAIGLAGSLVGCEDPQAEAEPQQGQEARGEQTRTGQEEEQKVEEAAGEQAAWRAPRMQAWDADRDDRISQDELQTGFERDVVGTWDQNDDGRIDRSEMTRGMFGAWDTNRDGAIDEQELERGARTWMGPAPQGELQQVQLQRGQMQPGQTQPGQTQPGQTRPGQTRPGQTQPGQTQPGGQVGQGQQRMPQLGDWDTNQDDRIDPQEFETGFGETDTFQQFDRDRDDQVTGEEGMRRLFESWDRDRNQTLDQNEWGFD